MTVRVRNGWAPGIQASTVLNTLTGASNGGTLSSAGAGEFNLQDAVREAEVIVIFGSPDASAELGDAACGSDTCGPVPSCIPGGFDKFEADLGAMLGQVTSDDLIDFGMIPEFIGRLPVVSVLDQLAIADLEKILLRTKNSMVKQYSKLFAMDGVQLRFTRDAIRAFQRSANLSETGEPTNLFESTPKDLLAALGREACEKLANETRDSNERSKLERALELA